MATPSSQLVLALLTQRVGLTTLLKNSLNWPFTLPIIRFSALSCYFFLIPPMLRLISCRQATLFVEKQAENALSFSDRSSLWMHLGYCAQCRRYAKQSAMLNRLTRAAAERRARLGTGLTDTARERLRLALLY